VKYTVHIVHFACLAEGVGGDAQDALAIMAEALVAADRSGQDFRNP